MGPHRAIQGSAKGCIKTQGKATELLLRDKDHPSSKVGLRLRQLGLMEDPYPPGLRQNPEKLQDFIQAKARNLSLQIHRGHRMGAD